MVPCLELFFFYCYYSELNISLALTTFLAITETFAFYSCLSYTASHLKSRISQPHVFVKKPSSRRANKSERSKEVNTWFHLGQSF